LVFKSVLETKFAKVKNPKSQPKDLQVTAFKNTGLPSPTTLHLFFKPRQKPKHRKRTKSRDCLAKAFKSWYL
jgi:hypothetical protein